MGEDLSIKNHRQQTTDLWYWGPSFDFCSPSSAKIFHEEFFCLLPGISCRFGLVNTRIAVSKKGVSGIGIRNYLVVYADIIQQLIELLYGACWNGLICIAEEAKYGSLQFCPQLVECLLHAAAIECADAGCSRRATRALRNKTPRCPLCRCSPDGISGHQKLIRVRPGQRGHTSARASWQYRHRPAARVRRGTGRVQMQGIPPRRNGRRSIWFAHRGPTIPG